MKRRLILLTALLMMLLAAASTAGARRLDVPDGFKKLDCSNGHNMSEVHVDNPTCTSKGRIYLECTRCGKQETKTVPALGHDLKWTGAWNPAPSCTQDGYKVYKCSRCSYTETKFGESATGHSGSTGRDNPTCTSGGRIYLVCDDCGKTVTKEKLLPLGHDWKQTYHEPATCAADGYKSYKCSRCSETKMETLPSTGKCSWGNWIVVTEATCSKDGLKVAECSVCGDTKKEILPAEGAHNYKPVSTKAATCTEDGSRTLECSRCGKTKTETIKAAGHSWKDSSVLKKATCTEEGQAESVCTVCGKTETRTLAKLGHSWGSWTVSRKATKTEDGLKVRTCRTCGKTQSQKISASSSGSASRDDVEGIEVFTTAGKVNLRKGPGKDNRRAGVVDRKNTCLGPLLESALDQKGTVWYKVEYKKKECWVMGDFAEAWVGILDLESERRPSGKKKSELTNYFLKSFDPTAEALEMTETDSEEAFDEWENDSVRISGWYYVENIHLNGEGYTLYGVEVGDKIKSALKTLKGKDLLLETENDGEYIYRVPCSPDSLSIDEDGFAATLILIADEDQKVQEIQLQADVSEEV